MPGHGMPLGGGGRLGGNPPTEFDGTRSKADTFMNEFNLYRLANIGVEQIDNPMKRMALMLSFVKGDKVKDWVSRWTHWAIRELNMGRAATDELFWTEVSRGFQQAFQDTGAAERAEKTLRELSFTPGEVDSFIATFESLAAEAGYDLNARATITLFASKLPFKMMDHLYKVVRPQDFIGWTEGARQYHQDNTAVQNIRGIFDDTPRKNPHQPKKTAGFSSKELAKILGVKLPLPDPNAMDTRADRFRSKKNSARGRTTTTTPKDKDKQHAEGRCYTCNKQGHMSRNCPEDKGKPKKDKASKSRKAETEDSGDESLSDASDDESEAFVRLGQSLKDKDKVAILRRAIEAEEGVEEISKQDF